MTVIFKGKSKVSAAFRFVGSLLHGAQHHGIYYIFDRKSEFFKKNFQKPKRPKKIGS